MKEYEGRKVVIQIEREEGIGIGEIKKSEQVVINENKEGLSNLILSKITGLTIGEVEKIIQMKTRQEDKEKE